MPNAKVLSEKQAIVEALAERIKNAGAGILVDYKGITVAEDTALRTELRKDGVEYTVVKNTLTRKALDKLGMSDLDHVLNGTTSLATAENDPIAPFRIINDYSKKLGDRFNIKAAFMEGKVLSESEIAEMAELPSKDALYAKVLGTMIAPITGLAVCLGQILEQKGGSLESAEAEAAAE
jgi:large subunit ribosomal protein L10